MSLTMNALDPTSLERKIAKRMGGHAHPLAYQAKKEIQTTAYANLPTFHVNVDYFFCLSVKNAWVRSHVMFRSIACMKMVFCQVETKSY